MNKIVAIPAFKDNYIWAIHSLEGSEIVVVDPGEAKPVLDYVQANKLILTAVMVTHHHWDHSGGIKDLISHNTNIKVYGPTHIQGVTHAVKDKDVILLPSHQLKFAVFAIPGHTLDHLAYYSEGILFCGDTLFSCGCGRVFEGTPEQMVHSLDKIKKFPGNTEIFCGHEYTQANIEFALKVDPSNEKLKDRQKAVKLLRENFKPSLPNTLSSELETNPFLRCNEKAIIQSVQHFCGQQLHDETAVFAQLRQWKNQFS